MNHKNIVYCIVVVLVAMTIILALLLAVPVSAEEAPIRTANQDALQEAADMLRALGYAEDSETMQEIQRRWLQEQDALNIIAKVIQNEADPQWCTWEHSVAVGAVVCNRVKSPYFPNSVKEVVAAPGQYLKSYTYGFDGVSRLAYEAAKAAMDGDHDVPENAYWQDNKKQGCYVWKAFVCDTGWFKSTTYICCGIPGANA